MREKDLGDLGSKKYWDFKAYRTWLGLHPRPVRTSKKVPNPLLNLNKSNKPIPFPLERITTSFDLIV